MQAQAGPQEPVVSAGVCSWYKVPARKPLKAAAVYEQRAQRSVSVRYAGLYAGLYAGSYAGFYAGFYAGLYDGKID